MTGYLRLELSLPAGDGSFKGTHFVGYDDIGGEDSGKLTIHSSPKIGPVFDGF